MGKPRGNQQATDPNGQPGAGGPSVGDRANSWAKKAGLWIGALAVLIIVVLILRAYLPRWWSHRIGGWVDGSMSRGVIIGLVLGFLCTFIPLLLLASPFFGRWRLQKWPSLIAVGLAIIVAIPNLLTLGIAIGTNNAAHAGQRTLDIEGPGFRAATLWGVIIGALIGAVVIFYMWRFRRRGQQIKDHKEQAKLASEAAKQNPGATGPGAPPQ
ncbi:hypothetical protein [Jongsikchunia kroppenstedtii]|uniref:hypothetical protein n=1 Tax=Jongsikchunia kroppenstedtii TaxID=1121721 RepID=UPI0003796435|nr:hypothetical protein [Jongsikchunia kroppenstedtii]